MWLTGAELWLIFNLILYIFLYLLNVLHCTGTLVVKSRLWAQILPLPCTNCVNVRNFLNLFKFHLPVYDVRLISSSLDWIKDYMRNSKKSIVYHLIHKWLLLLIYIFKKEEMIKHLFLLRIWDVSQKMCILYLVILLKYA